MTPEGDPRKSRSRSPPRLTLGKGSADSGGLPVGMTDTEPEPPPERNRPGGYAGSWSQSWEGSAYSWDSGYYSASDSYHGGCKSGDVSHLQSSISGDDVDDVDEGNYVWEYNSGSENRSKWCGYDDDTQADIWKKYKVDKT